LISFHLPQRALTRRWTDDIAGNCLPSGCWRLSEDDGKHREGRQHNSLSVRAADRRPAGKRSLVNARDRRPFR